MKKIVNGVEVALSAEEIAQRQAEEAAWVAGPAKAGARTRINAARDAAISAGVTFGGVAYDSDAESRAALNAALTVFGPAGAVPEGFTWRAADNTDHALTLEQLHGLAAAMLEHGYAQHVKARALKDAIEAAATLAEVGAITWES